MADKIITRPGMGHGGHYRHAIGLDEGNHLGHVDVYLWTVSAEDEDARPGLRERSEARGQNLRDRLAALIELDPECQDILRAEKQDRADAAINCNSN